MTKLQLVPPIANGLAGDTITLGEDPSSDLGVGDEASIDAAITFVLDEFFHKLSCHQRVPKLRIVQSR